MSGLQWISGPEDEPLSLAEVKAHLRIVYSTPAEDADLMRKLKSARRWLETKTGLVLLPQVWKYWFDVFPSAVYLEIPKGPILSIDSVSSYSEANVLTAFPTTDYEKDIVRGRVLLNSGKSWPSLVRGYHAGVIQFTAGYGTTPESVPEDLVEAVAEMTGYFYYDREGVDPVPQKVLDVIAGREVVVV